MLACLHELVHARSSACSTSQRPARRLLCLCCASYLLSLSGAEGREGGGEGVRFKGWGGWGGGREEKLRKGNMLGPGEGGGWGGGIGIRLKYFGYLDAPVSFFQLPRAFFVLYRYSAVHSGVEGAMRCVLCV